MLRAKLNEDRVELQDQDGNTIATLQPSEALSLAGNIQELLRANQMAQ